jgi:hypothetical protein
MDCDCSLVMTSHIRMLTLYDTARRVIQVHTMIGIVWSINITSKRSPRLATASTASCPFSTISDFIPTEYRRRGWGRRVRYRAGRVAVYHVAITSTTVSDFILQLHCEKMQKRVFLFSWMLSGSLFTPK